MAKSRPFTEQDLRDKGYTPDGRGGWEKKYNKEESKAITGIDGLAVTGGYPRLWPSGELADNAPASDRTVPIEIGTRRKFAHASNGIVDTFETEDANIAAVFFIDPVAKPRQTRKDSWKPAKRVLKYRAFADELRAQAARLNYVLGHELHIRFYIPLYKSWSKKEKLMMLGKPHQATPDGDNLIKAFQDALAKQDKTIWKGSWEKTWSIQGMIIVYHKPFQSL